MLEWVAWICGWVINSLLLGAVVSLLTFVVPMLVQAFYFKEQDLKTKYNAKWALVTGGSSGIGRAITEKLASQGINVVIAALDDPLLPKLVASLEKDYPQLQFRPVPVDLGGNEYMEPIIKATQDIEVPLVFNNAGYLAIGFFSDMAIERQVKNVNVNAMAAMCITHHFVREMIDKKLRGAVTFTSSPAGQMPCPFSLVYGASKAFLTEFGTSLAAEVAPDGIDVLVLHPSPVDTNFYNAESAHKSSSLAFFRKTATPPTTIANTIFTSVGQPLTVVREQGYFAVCLRMLIKIVDVNFLSYLTAKFSATSAEYKTLITERKRGKKMD
eukprot:TRINITY_DN864_c0_g1_i1.p1 TRINITY_DN864_c0_g1~~TRINITY_DN864_c0_g1_i1.p1  ORF type:complete len:327 (+),score=69.66 TRINITY_DN864_c0_g1_i1:125-1105(+)